MFNPYDQQKARQDAIDEVRAEEEYNRQVRVSRPVDFGISDEELAEMSIPERNLVLARIEEDFRAC